MVSKIGKSEWVFLYIATGAIDITQLLIDLTGVGIAINEVIDPFIAVLLGGYLQLRGVSMTSRISRLASLFGVGVLEEITGGIAPAWVVDIWYIQRSVRQEEAELKAQEDEQNFLQQNMRKPLYADGQRLPPDSSQESVGPSNQGGIRAPGGGLINNQKK